MGVQKVVSFRVDNRGCICFWGAAVVAPGPGRTSVDVGTPPNLRCAAGRAFARPVGRVPKCIGYEHRGARNPRVRSGSATWIR